MQNPLAATQTAVSDQSMHKGQKELVRHFAALFTTLLVDSGHSNGSAEMQQRCTVTKLALHTLAATSAMLYSLFIMLSSSLSSSSLKLLR